MSDTKWTNGPWSYRPREFDDWGFVRGDRMDSDGRLIAIARYDRDYTDDELSEFRVRKDDPCKYTGRLIAAAPELYEALKCFLEDDRFQVGVGGNPLVVKRMIASARAALAKARGQQ